MFTIDKKEYDETKLDGKAKIALNNVTVLLNEKNELMHKLEKNKILSEYYSEVLKKNLPKSNGKDKK
jgi:hypothetical protein|tara:strand:- start:65 stop:265 length:201 start_codon:yes stop_codon:yes gene_type:complete